MPGPRLPDHARILVIKAAGLGDVVLALPALRMLRRAYPHAHIDLLTTPPAAALLRDSPLVDRVLTFDKTPFDAPSVVLRAPWRLPALVRLACRLHAARYDAVLLFHHLTLPFGRLKYRLLLATTGWARSYGLDNGHGGFLTVRVPDAGFGARHEAAYCLAVAQAAGAAILPACDGPRLADLGWDDAPERALATPPLVALHPGSGTYSLARRWPLPRFVALARALHRDAGADILLVGGHDERDLIAAACQSLGDVPWVARTEPDITPRALAAQFARCDLFVGNDAFPAHLAAAAGVPVVAIFGPSNAAAWRPLPRDAARPVVVVRRDLPCSPCFYRGRALGTPQGCPPRPCLEDLPVVAVLREALRLLERDPAPAGLGRA
ncbi:MAG TPA: glycosyltransferase family 9 protein [Ktedonobacterales bacterium]